MGPDFPGIKSDLFIDRSIGTAPLKIGRTESDATEFPDILMEAGKSALVRIKDYSGVYIFSLEFSIIRLTSLYAAYRSEDQLPGDKQQLISSSFYHAASIASLASTRAADVARALTKHGAKGVCIVEQPVSFEIGLSSLNRARYTSNLPY